jgi:hypothetical protein
VRQKRATDGLKRRKKNGTEILDGKKTSREKS